MNNFSSQLPPEDSFPKRKKERLVWWGLMIPVFLLAAWLRWHVYQVYLDNLAFLTPGARAALSMKVAEALLMNLASSGAAVDLHNDDSGFALLIAAFWKLTGSHTSAAIQLSTVALDLLCLLLLAVTSKRVFGRLAGLLTAVLYAVYMPIIIELFMLNDLVYVPQFVVLLTWLLTFPFHSRLAQVLQTLAVALVSGLAILVRSTFSFYPLLITAFLMLKLGVRRGVILGALMLLVCFGSAHIVKKMTAGSSHFFWHSFYCGLGDFPNGSNMSGVDTDAFVDVADTVAGTKPYQGEYDEILKGRSLAVVDESPRAYLQLLAKRTWKVLFGRQDWWRLAWVGPTVSQADILSWILFLLHLVGVGLAVRLGLSSSAPFLISYLYFGLILVPVITAHSEYYLASSVMQIPFAAFALSRLKGLIPEWGLMGDREEWIIDPYDRRIILTALLGTLLVAAVGVSGILVFAHQGSVKWRSEMLDRIKTMRIVQKWDGSGGFEMARGHDNPIALSRGTARGIPHFFHTVVEVKRGRVGFDVRNASGHPISRTTYNCGPGKAHCFIGWIPPATGEYTLHAWDSLPRDWPENYDDENTETLLASFLHYQIEDHAKFEFFPNNRLEVSSSLFPNGYETMPFKVEKLRWGIREPNTVPGYWAGRRPCSARLFLPHEPLVSQLVIHQIPSSVGIPTISLRKAGATGFSPLEVLKKEEGRKGCDVRIYVEPVQISALEIAFKEQDKEGQIAYLKDIGLPDEADFEVLGTTLYRAGDSPNAVGYPGRLSFLDPE
jgi:hypothetical protein